MPRKGLKLIRKHPGLLLYTLNPGTRTANKGGCFKLESDGIVELGVKIPIFQSSSFITL